MNSQKRKSQGKTLPLNGIYLLNHPNFKNYVQGNLSYWEIPKYEEPAKIVSW